VLLVVTFICPNK